MMDTEEVEVATVPEEEPGIVTLPSSRYDREEFAYLKNSGFSSEIFKIEIRNLPKYYGYGELKKFINQTCSLDCNKIKVPRKNSSFGFLCFKNEEGKY